jgi:DNA-binding Xre family transcriptional regulator
MIKNEKQYKISKKLLSELDEKIYNAQKGVDGDEKKQVIVNSLSRLKSQVANELIQYEILKNGKADKLKERNLSQLPSLITEYKIANNLTQKDLSQKLGLKEQQLQRYEAEGFKTVSFQNLVKFLDLMKLELTIKATPLKKRKAKKSTLQP